MKKIINGKRYDTDTAKEIGYASYSNRSDFSFWEETLYRKQTGEYFLFGEGGPMSRYAVTVGQNQWSGGEKIMPLSVDAAKEWAEKYLDADEYEKAFGEVEEDATKRVVTFSLPENVIETIKRKAAENKMNMSEYIANVIMEQK